MTKLKTGWIYGISDIIVPFEKGPTDKPETDPTDDEDTTPSKYQKVYSQSGKLLGEVEVYLIGYDDE